MTALLRVARCTQAHLSSSRPQCPRAELDDVEFAKMVYGDRMGTATHYLEDNGRGGVLPLDHEISGRSVLDILGDKHPDPAAAYPSILLAYGPAPPDNVLFEAIALSRVRAAIMTMKGEKLRSFESFLSKSKYLTRWKVGMKGAARPSGLDAAVWRWMVSMFSTASNALCASLARMAKCLCTEPIEPSHLRPFSVWPANTTVQAVCVAPNCHWRGVPQGGGQGDNRAACGGRYRSDAAVCRRSVRV